MLNFLVTSTKFIHGYLKECQESIENPPTSANIFAPILIDYYPLPDEKFGRNC